MNVLLVEDDEVDVMNVKRAFKKNNISNPLYIASNGLEALAMLRGSPNQFDAVPTYRRLILLDLNMPKMGGIEFLHALRADPLLQTTPVVVLTTSNRDQDRLAAYHFNIAGYLLKPLTLSAFAHLMAVLNDYWMLCEMP